MFTAKRALGSSISLMVILFVGIVSMANVHGEKEAGMEQRLTKKDLPPQYYLHFKNNIQMPG
jgi:hypothetical protein